MQQLDFIVMAVFAVFQMVVGLAFSRTGKDSKSFFAAGEAAPWWISGLSLFMSFLSAGTFVVWGSIAYNLGFVAITIQLSMCIGGLVTAWFIAAKWKNTQVMTAAEYIGRRLGVRVQQFFTYLLTIVTLFITGGVLYPVGKLVYVATPFSLETCIIVLGLMVILYTAMGGLWAVLVTDVLQFVILLSAVLILVPLAFDQVEGPGAFVEKVPVDFFQVFNGEYTLEFTLAFVMYHIVYIGGSWAFVQRFTSVRTPQESKKVAFLFAGLYAVSPFLWMLPPMIYRALNPSLSGLESEGAYMLMAQRVLPVGLVGLMLAAMVSATASTANTLLNMLAAVFTNDVYKKLLRPAASDASLVKVGRSMTVVFGLIAIGIALLVPHIGGLVNLVLSIGAISGGSLLLPVVWTLFSKRQNATSILTVALISLAVGLFFKLVSPALFSFSLSRAAEMMVGVGVPALLLAVFEWLIFGKKISDPAYDTFQRWADERQLANEAAAAEVNTGTNTQNTFALRAISISFILTGLSIAGLGINSGENIVLIAGIGSVLVLVGGWIGWSARTTSVAARQSTAVDEKEPFL
ncbi:sodium:solute symporter family protein [Arundinibacter roseus]|uniref:Sodium transporter n=1 Tax=Arundinibacter roseus TaxID=2070510 RepID=A0A4R4JVV2_9BACT|nr:sodium:solute symporter family protein [Arundinibacter roseus]TDB58232.1 sodium transporter [Arundinibacter roseus]